MLKAGWQGRRVSVRRVADRGPDGRDVLGDVVGDLVDLGASRAVIDTRDGPVEVGIDTVVAARLALPSTADELALEAVAAAGWLPAETDWLGGWLLRANDGFTGRANSVLPLRAPGLPLDDAIAQARSWYAQRGLPLRIMVPTEARRLLDAGLAERGWPADADVHTMAARLDHVRATASRADVDVTIDDRPDDTWFARYRDGRGADAAARALLTRHPNAGYATVRDGGRTVAIGRGVVDDRWLGVTAVEVEPALRRTGLATAVMRALWAWGRDRHATRSYLQVSGVNVAAVALYERLGYFVHHDYRYRVDPASDLRPDAQSG